MNEGTHKIFSLDRPHIEDHGNCDINAYEVSLKVLQVEMGILYQK